MAGSGYTKIRRAIEEEWGHLTDAELQKAIELAEKQRRETDQKYKEYFLGKIVAYTEALNLIKIYEENKA